MAPTRQKNRNYRRQPPPADSSPDDLGNGLQQHQSSPPPSFSDVVCLLRPAAPLSSSGDLGGSNNSSAEHGQNTGNGGEEREGKDDGRRGRGGREGGGKTGVEIGGFQNGAKRIANGVGYNMLKSMGWRENTGLGQSSSGIINPILPKTKPNHLGIGYNPTAAHDAAQEEIRQIQKAKREERDRKLQLKLEKAEEAEEEAIFMRESYVAVPNTSYEHLPKSDARLQGHKSTEPGQCPHCRQRFDTEHALKSHINARHAKLLLATKRQFKKEKRQGNPHGSRGTSNRSRKGSSAHGLAPMSQDFSVYD